MYRQNLGDQLEDMWHWFVDISSHIKRLGLHNESIYGSLDTKTTRLYRNIWWAFFVRDHLVSLALCTVPIARSTDVNLIELEDLEPIAYSDYIARAVGVMPYNETHGLQTHLSSLYIAQIQLCLILNRFFSKSNSRLPVRLQHLTRDQVVSEATNAEMCYMWLLEWYNCFAASALNPSLQNLGWNELSGFHVPALLIEFNAVLVLVFQHEAALCETYDGAADVLPSLPSLRQSRGLAATGMVRAFHHLQFSGHLHHPPSTLLTLLLPATIVHLLNLCSPECCLSGDSMVQYQQCLALVRTIEQDYPCTHSWTVPLKRAAAKFIAFAESQRGS